MATQQHDPRDIERINPENGPFDTNVNTIPTEGEGTADNTSVASIQGAVIKEPSGKPAKKAPSKAPGGKHAA